MNLSNRLTILRIFLAFICMGFILQGTFVSLITALLIFIFAAFTDFLDGFIARRRKAITDLGKLLDPIADKILIVGVFLSFLELGIISAWMVIAIMVREFLITGLRLFTLNRGVVLEAKRFGKHKTASQLGGIIVIFIILIIGKQLPSSKASVVMLAKVLPLVMWYIVSITVFSGLYYLWTNRKAIKTY